MTQPKTTKIKGVKGYYIRFDDLLVQLKTLAYPFEFGGLEFFAHKIQQKDGKVLRKWGVSEKSTGLRIGKDYQCNTKKKVIVVVLNAFQGIGIGAVRTQIKEARKKII
ncbi:MAG: hypothetical protein GY870_05385 [archaeon]|nr:hypothetical protein [archaeon]